MAFVLVCPDALAIAAGQLRHVGSVIAARNAVAAPALPNWPQRPLTQYRFDCNTIPTSCRPAPSGRRPSDRHE